MKLPEGWSSTTLDKLLVQIVGGGTPSKANTEFFRGTLPFMTVKDMKDRFPTDTIDHISNDAVEASATSVVPADTLIVATRMSLGKVVRPRFETAINQDLKALFIAEGIDKTFIEHWWRWRSGHIQSLGTGTTVKGIRLDDIRSLEIDVPPAGEQKRIADKLDAVLARVDACRERLDRVPAILKRFRQAVLAAATSGRLTEEPTSACVPLEGCDFVQLSQVLSEVVTGPFGSSLHKADYVVGGIPVINPMHINRGVITPSSEMTVSPQKAQQLSDFALRVGDVVIARRGVMGRCAVVPPHQQGWLCGTGSMILRVIPSLMPEYLRVFLSSPATVQALEADAVGSTMVNLNQRIMLSLQFRLPSTFVQHEIVRRVESLFAYADHLEALYAAARAKVEALTPALLAKAFRGELVPQDPNDEPASVLLERIRATRAEQPAAQRRPRPPATRIPRTARENTAMPKSRHDDDVQHKPYLAGLLRIAGGTSSVEDLFKRAELPVTDFYKQLAWEVDNGHVRDDETRLGAA